MSGQSERHGGRARKGGTAVLVRIEPGLIRALDAWIMANDPEASRPSAVRKIIAKVLGVPEEGP